MRKIQVTLQFFEASGPQSNFFKKKIVFRYGLGECVYQISGRYRFSLGQELLDKPTYLQVNKKIRGFWFKNYSFYSKIQDAHALKLVTYMAKKDFYS